MFFYFGVYGLIEVLVVICICIVFVVGNVLFVGDGVDVG